MRDLEQCRVLVGNLRTMCEEIDELLSLGEGRDFARLVDALSEVAEGMGLAVDLGAELAGALDAETAGAAAEQRSRAEAFARFDLAAERDRLARQAFPDWDARKRRGRAR